MIFPIRCMSCGKPIGHLWDNYKKMVESGEEPKKALDKLDLNRYCCRSVFLTYIELIDKVGRFSK